MTQMPVQDHYLEPRAHCWGCGRLNPQGLHIKSSWDGEEMVGFFQPQANFTAHPGYLNGGIIATLIDCNSMAICMTYAHKQEDRQVGTEPLITYVTASLHVDYLKPTPLSEAPVEVRARIIKVDGRKTWVGSALYADGVQTVRGEVLGIRFDDVP